LAEATNQLQLPDCDSSLAANVANTLIHSYQNNEITPGYIADGVFEAHGMSPGGGGPAILDDVVEEVWCTKVLHLSRRQNATTMLMQKGLVSQFALVPHVSQVQLGSSAK
jgi:hypothetical protein